MILVRFRCFRRKRLLIRKTVSSFCIGSVSFPPTSVWDRPVFLVAKREEDLYLAFVMQNERAFFTSSEKVRYFACNAERVFSLPKNKQITSKSY